MENIAGFKFWAVLTMMERGWLGGSFLVYAAINLVLVMASVMLTVYWSPAAAGSGIAEVKVRLRGYSWEGVLGWVEFLWAYELLSCVPAPDEEQAGAELCGSRRTPG